ncbi:MAG: hypothetical protein Q8941_06700 [Bacteroidota bacterium]|nr:hypothetical protein [Bacteroidota bacterium]
MALRSTRSLLIVLVLLLFVPGFAKSQVILIPEVQGTGIVMKQQIWSLMINNLSGTVKKSILYITITDRTTSQTLLEANSGMLIVNPGAKRITYQDLSPVNFAVSIIGFSDVRQLNQPMPVGDYLVCYKLIEVESSPKESLADECVKISTEPLSPPQLIRPENETLTREKRPVLSWSPPAPVNMFTSLSYDIIVSPLYEKQSPQEALQRNIPVMTTSSVNNSLLYPSSFTDLEAGKTYVWQVVATDGGRFGGKSEVWSFTIMPDSVAKIISSAPFIRLKKQNNETTVLQQSILKMEYFNALADSVVHVEVYRAGEKNNKYKQSFSFDLRVKGGQNFLEYDLNGKLHADESSVYEVKLVNSRKEEWQMMFTPKNYF